MNATEKNVLDKFKSLLLDRVRLHKMVLFGSMARGDAGSYSDIDVVVILDNLSDTRDFDHVSDCAWEAGFEHGIIIVPFLHRKNGRTVLNGIHYLRRP